MFWIVTIAAGIAVVLLLRRWRGAAIETGPHYELPEAYAKGCDELRRAANFKRGDPSEFENVAYIPLAVMQARRTRHIVELEALNPTEFRTIELAHAAHTLDVHAFRACADEADEEGRIQLERFRKLFIQPRISRAELAITLSMLEGPER